MDVVVVVASKASELRVDLQHRECRAFDTHLHVGAMVGWAGEPPIVQAAAGQGPGKWLDTPADELGRHTAPGAAFRACVAVVCKKRLQLPGCRRHVVCDKWSEGYSVRCVLDGPCSRATDTSATPLSDGGHIRLRFLGFGAVQGLKSLLATAQDWLVPLCGCSWRGVSVLC